MLTPDQLSQFKSAATGNSLPAGTNDLSSDAAYQQWKSQAQQTAAPAAPPGRSLLQEGASIVDPIVQSGVRFGQAVGAAGIQGANALTGGALDKYAKGGSVKGALNDYMSKPTTNPLSGTQIKPVNEDSPESVTGNALGTVALGMGNPAAAGALMAGGAAMNDNRSASSVALNTAAGAIGGKILELGFHQASPLIEAAGLKYGAPLLEKISHFVPDSAKAAFDAFASHVAENVPDLANTKVLPDAASKAISGTTDAISKAVDAPLSAIGNMSSKVTGQTKALAGKGMDAISGGPKSASEAVGQIVQGKAGDVKPAMTALGTIDTKGIKTYADLASRLDKQVPTLADQVDAELSKDSKSYTLDELSKTDKTKSGQPIKTDYVSTALKHLSELYETTGDTVDKANMEELLKKAQETGLSRKEVNDISRVYGSEFGSKAFSKVTGDPLTSVNAQKFENVRSGLKDVARAGLGGPEAQAADKTLSSILNTRALVQKQAEQVNKLKQKIDQRGIGEKIGHVVTKTLDTLSGGTLRGITSGLLQRGTGLKTLNALDLESNLQRNLQILQKAIDANSDNDVIKALQQLAQPSAAADSSKR